MSAYASSKHSLEILESRIAPASVIATSKFIPAIVGGATILHAGQGLGTATENSGTYLLYVEKGDCLVFTTDFNNNGAVDFNEITGIAAGDGLRLISFVNIYGDIVTNLDTDGTLSDSDNNTSNDDPFLKGDGRVVRNNTIEKIELRSLTTNDLNDQNNDGAVDDTDVSLRLAVSSYSIFGSIYAGKGFGVSGDATSGLIIDDTGRAQQQADFSSGLGFDYFYDFKPAVNSIRTGSAVSGEFFSFGISRDADLQGLLSNFVSPNGQTGGDIVGVRAASATTVFNIDAILTGDGGVGARGGNIEDVLLNGDTAGGYIIKAGNGGRGPNGGTGGSILNFQDVGSVTSEIVIRAGDGGNASTGVGGAAGNIAFGTLNVNGGLGITLGSGGDGFTAGGDGASLTTALITTPEGAVPFTNTIISSVHDPLHDPVTGRMLELPAIGRTKALDIDHDGFGDAVFTSQDPDQLVVVFGDGTGFFKDPVTNTSTATPGKLNRIYLPGVNVGDAVTVGDFNGDGFYDIATGSHFSGNFGGISVFLAQTEDTNQDGILSKAEDFDRDGVIDFLGFESPRQSPLPALHRGDPDGGFLLDASYAYMRSAVPIADIEAGDFNGDGFTDLAVAAIETDQGSLVQRPVVIFMTANIENGRPNGTFFADVGTKAVADPPQGANPFVPFFFLGAGTSAVIEATAGAVGDTHDIVVGQAFDSSASVFSIDNFLPSILGPLFTGSAVPIVDTDRGPGFAPVRPSIQDFTISDTNLDGFADITIISANPPGFLVASLGDGGVPFPPAGFLLPVIGSGGNNTGVYFPEFGLGTDQVQIRCTSAGAFLDPFAPDNLFDEVVVESQFDLPLYVDSIFDIADAPTVPLGNNGDTSLFPLIDLPAGFSAGHVRSIAALDIWIPDPVNFPDDVQYLTGLPTLVPIPDFNGIEANSLLGLYVGFSIPLAEHYIDLSTGNGGDGLVGNGGIGGNLGDVAAIIKGTDPVTGITDANLLGSVFVVLPVNTAFGGVVTFTAGDGGNGFSFGGKGGSIAGTAVRYAGPTPFHTEISLFGGDGGFGVAGGGGAGGDLLANTLQSGTFLTAGNGGRGTIGGAGGSIVGNGNDTIYDSEDNVMMLKAGQGGNGIKLGGAGGDIINFSGQFDLFIAGETGGLLYHIAGNGGNAISGPGGRGGNVTNSSPLDGENTLAGDIILIGGHGGNGLSGGDGGSVSNFVNRPSEADNPAILAFLAGTGGNGTTGRGGNGGSVTNIETPSVGKVNPFFDSIFLDPRIPPMPYPFNRFLAGDGGKSAGSRGGNGGNVSNIVTSNSDNTFAIVSGAGGNGLFRGGAGGNLQDIEINLGSESLNKALFIAGAGGSAASWKSNNLDTSTGDQGSKYFGGRIGKPGAGGNIVNINQSGSIGCKLDFIAGNGGDLINYGTVADEKLPVGKGGSIVNVTLAGNIGNIQSNIRLSSYNDVIAGQTLQDFVTINLRDPLVPGSFDDSIGMVGLVAGSAGRLKEVPNGFDPSNTINYRSQPATNGVNGSVINITARNIASMVAGSVERIAAIQIVGGINLPGGGILGKDFDDNIDSARYRNSEGAPILEPVLDGSLVDGALVYSKFKKQTDTDKLPPSPRIFQLGNRPNRAHV